MFVHDNLIGIVRQYTKPCFPQQTAIRVEDVRTKWRVHEDVIHTRVGKMSEGGGRCQYHRRAAGRRAEVFIVAGDVASLSFEETPNVPFVSEGRYVECSGHPVRRSFF